MLLSVLACDVMEIILHLAVGKVHHVMAVFVIRNDTWRLLEDGEMFLYFPVD